MMVGEWKLDAEIDDLSKADWRGVLEEAPNLCEGDTAVTILGPNGDLTQRSRARVVPGGPYQPTVLEGLEPFS